MFFSSVGTEIKCNNSLFSVCMEGRSKKRRDDGTLSRPRICKRAGVVTGRMRGKSEGAMVRGVCNMRTAKCGRAESER